MFYRYYLEEYLEGVETVDEMINAFEKMCLHRNCVVDDFVFAQSDNFEDNGTTHFCVSLVRQYRNNVFSENFTQTCLDIFFEVQPMRFANRRILKTKLSSLRMGGSFSMFFCALRESKLLAYIHENNLQVLHFEITESDL